MSSATGTRGKAFVISAPSGTGKTTVCHKLLASDPRLRFSVSHTTRPPRPGESNGIDYYFVDEAEFQRLIEEGEFLEHAQYTGNLYGTSYAAVETSLEEGIDVLLEIEVQGAKLVRDARFDAVFIFLLPPSLEELDVRLRGRGTDAENVIEKRLAEARSELEMADVFDYAIVNDDLEKAVAEVREVIEAERTGDSLRVRARLGRKRVMEVWRKAAEKP
ncbi:MAG: guanylate kinase [Myxococcota bacterium]|jgi:guanylate kinase|nr:guanylate kinase [Myxococcota bacterium]